MEIIKVKMKRDIPENYTGIVKFASGAKAWFLNGEFHREDGPAIEWSDGTKIWFLNGVYHREDGPAVIYPNGDKEYWLNGKYHREDGPAVEWSNGARHWYLNGKKLNEDMIKFLVDLEYPEKAAIRLNYGCRL